jgi:hypothetical protein
MDRAAEQIVIGDQPYVIDEALEDGRLILRPDTSVSSIRERLGTGPMDPEQFEATFGGLPGDAEG